jgi:hypothetical protein
VNLVWLPAGHEAIPAAALGAALADDEAKTKTTEEEIILESGKPMPGGRTASELATGVTDDNGATEIEDTGVLCW